MGRRAEAQKLLRDFEQKTPLVAPYEIAVANAGLNDANGVFAALEKAYAVRDVNLVFLPVDPKWIHSVLTLGSRRCSIGAALRGNDSSLGPR